MILLLLFKNMIFFFLTEAFNVTGCELHTREFWVVLYLFLNITLTLENKNQTHSELSWAANELVQTPSTAAAPGPKTCCTTCENPRQRKSAA